MKMNKRMSLKDRLNKIKSKKKHVKFNLKTTSNEESSNTLKIGELFEMPQLGDSQVLTTADDSQADNDVVDRAGPVSNFNRSDSSSIISSLKKNKKRKYFSSQLLRADFNTSLNDSVDVIDETIKHDVNNVKKKFRRDNYSLKLFLEDSYSTDKFDSRKFAEKCLTWLINPYTAEDFQSNCWEKKPLVLKRHQKDYYSHLFSTSELETILKENDLQYTRNIDIAIYENDERKTFNPDGRVYPACVWDRYREGCSIRLLNPQTYSKNVLKICSILQEYFHSFVGANVYLTPAESQGFAPHYDDIEAFILQLEGKKVWKVYDPLDEDSTLPRFPSKNFKRAELVSEPALEIVLEPGDLLYIPRGFIHEGKTTEDHHSLHITLSTSQKHTYGDLMEILLKQALEMAHQEDAKFRESLPLNYLSFMGIVNQETTDKRRENFLGNIKNLFSKLLNHMNVDLAVDHFSKDFIHAALPPQLHENEKKLSILEGAEKWKDGQIVEGIDIDLDTEIKLIRYASSRLVVEEDDVVRLYHTLENSKVYKENELQYIEIPSELSGAVEHLMNTYPNLCRIRDLPLESDEEKMDIASLLFDKSIIILGENSIKKEKEEKEKETS